MLRKVAVALLAATMFSAPVLAQGTGGAPARTNTPVAAAPAAAPKVVAAKPTLKSAKRVSHRRSAHVRHVKPAKHMVHVKRVKHVKKAHHIKRSKPATFARGGMQTAVKSRSGAY